MKFTDDQILKDIQEVLSKILKTTPMDIQIDSSLGDDLGIDSVEGLDLAYALEDRFHIKITDTEVQQLKTIRDIVENIKRKI